MDGGWGWRQTNGNNSLFEVLNFSLEFKYSVCGEFEKKGIVVVGVLRWIGVHNLDRKSVV